MEAVDGCFFCEVEFDFGGGLLFGTVFQCGECVGDHGGGVVELEAVDIGGLVVDGFDVAAVRSADDDVEGV